MNINDMAKNAKLNRSFELASYAAKRAQELMDLELSGMTAEELRVKLQQEADEARVRYETATS